MILFEILSNPSHSGIVRLSANNRGYIYEPDLTLCKSFDTFQELITSVTKSPQAASGQ